jgi:phosphatidylglycerophosphatase C
MTKVALFDLDGTLTWRDTLLPFLGGFLSRHPRRYWRLWRLPPVLLGYAVHRDRGALKSHVIQIVLGGEARAAVDGWADFFVAHLGNRLRPAALAVLEAHRRADDRLVLLSASPDLYVPRIGRALGFELTLCTEIVWNGDTLDGRLKTANRHGEEKVRCLEWVRSRYPGLPIIAYGNSASDLDHLRKADQALLVNGNAGARRLAAESQIAVSEWS